MGGHTVPHHPTPSYMLSVFILNSHASPFRNQAQDICAFVRGS